MSAATWAVVKATACALLSPAILSVPSTRTLAALATGLPSKAWTEKAGPFVTAVATADLVGAILRLGPFGTANPEPVFAIADEDLERENEEKTSAVHFVRFELNQAMKVALRSGAQLKVGCDHPEYLAQQDELAPETLAALLRDLT